jgi:glycosyltransferase involved in cell wall biosynthesis
VVIDRQPKLLIVGGFSFSGGEAGTNYVLGLGNALRDSGFEVHYLAPCTYQGIMRHDFQQYVCHVAPEAPLLGGWRDIQARLTGSGNSLIKWLERARAEEFDTIIAYPDPAKSVGFLLKLRSLCLKRAWKLIVIVVEWHGFSWSGWGGLPRRMLIVVDWETQLRVLNKRSKRIIAITSFVERYYGKSGCDVIRIPPMIDAQADKWHCRPLKEDPKPDLTLLFSGSWTRDRLDLIMEAVLYLRHADNRVVLELLGPTQNDIENNPGLQKFISQAPQGTFRFHGYIRSEERVLPITASADFCVLLRDRARWSDACFPSKVPECQALGVPILCNLTSDLGETLRDGENALIVPHVSVGALVTTIKRALALTPSERARLKRGSLQCAATHFDYRNYIDQLSEFIRRI